MTTQVSELKAAISVSEMCRLLRISRSQFYWHVEAGTFHPPLYLVRNRRPFFTTALAEANLQARDTGIGVSGQYVVFYKRVRAEGIVPPPTRKVMTPQTDHSKLITSLRSLGLDNVTDSLVDAALKVCFPAGTVNQDDSEVLRTVYRHLRRAKGS